MKARYAIAAAILAATSAAAQEIPGPGLSSGYLINRPTFQFTEMLNLSQNQFSLGTARSAAMAGAFASLGADISSMSINPAGLGMYRSSDIAVTPSLTVSGMTNSRAGSFGMTDLGGNRTTFGIGNFGAAFNVYESSRTSLTSFTFGFGYNKLANFNYDNKYMLDEDGLSIADLFMNQIRGLRADELNRNAYPNPWQNNNIHPSEWGGVLGYQTALIDPVYNGGDNKLYTINAIDGNASIGHYMRDRVSGSIGEYAFSFGFNFRNVVYAGLTLGLQDIYYKQEMYYEEYYRDNNISGDHLEYMQYMPGMSLRGIGYNAKIGIIVRPLPELRIGAAFHTPTFYDVERSYQAEMRTVFQDQGEEGYNMTNLLYYYPKFSSPPRLMVGASYSFGGVAVLAVDYDRTWYNGMRLKGDASPIERDMFKKDIKSYFRAANNVRVGLEVKPIPDLALRAGYGYYDSGLKTKKVDGLAPSDAVYDMPVIKSSNNYTAGIGFRFGNLYIDAAYSYMHSKYTETDLFYYDGKVPNYDTGAYIDATYIQGELLQQLSRHSMMLTLGYRF